MADWTEIENLAKECENGLVPRHGITEDEIKAYESALGFEFSQTLREWVSVRHCDLIGPGGILSVEPNDESFGILQRVLLHPDWKNQGWVPIGGDWCGNYYVVATKGEGNLREPVYFVDAYEDQNRPTYIAASDLYGFIQNYLLHDPGKMGFHWPFDKDKTLALDPRISTSSSPLPWDA